MEIDEKEALERVRRRLLGEARLALGHARALMRDLRSDGGADEAELEKLARKTDLLFAELEALGGAGLSVPDAMAMAQSASAQSSSSSSSSNGSSVA